MRTKRIAVYISFLRWIVNHELKNATIPIPLRALYDSYRREKGKKGTSYTNLKNLIENFMKSQELREEFTKLQMAQLLFVLSLEVNSNFENILKNEGHQIELTNPDRRISFFRSQDGSIERRGVHQPAQGAEQDEDGDQDDELVDEDEQENMDDYAQNYDDPVVFNGQQEQVPRGIDQQDQQIMAEEVPQRNEQEHTKLNEREGNSGQPNVKLNQRSAEEEQGNVAQRRGIKRARIESSQQAPQGNTNDPLPMIADNQFSQNVHHPVAKIPEAASATTVRETPRENSALLPQTAPTITSQANPSPAPSAVPTKTRKPVPTTPRPNYPTPTVTVFLKNLRASFQSLRTPVLSKVIESITEEIKKHQNNSNPVSITNVAESIPAIVHFANQGDPVDKEEETISQRRFVEILAQSFTLLNSPVFDAVLETLKAKKYSLDYIDKISVKDVELGVSTLLRKACGRSEKKRTDLSLEQEKSAFPRTYDVLICLYASVSNLKYLNRSSTVLDNIILAILAHKKDEKQISLEDLLEDLPSIIRWAGKEEPKNSPKFLVSQKRYLEALYHTLDVIDSDNLKEFMVDLDGKMKNLNYDKKIRLEKVNQGLGNLLMAITDLRDG